VTPKAVFFLRSDIQMQEIYGSAAWPVVQFQEMWHRLEGQGHEIAWHPHVWRWSDQWGCWFQETKDSPWIAECLEVGYSDFAKRFGSNPVTCHMGWTFHNNCTMQKLAELGVKIDFSASPGVHFGGGPGDGGTVFDNRIDWLETPFEWYRPSESDYRRPARAGEKELAIIEVPKFTSESGVLRWLKDIAARGKRTPGHEAGAAVFLQVTALPVLYGTIIKQRLQRKEAEPFFATYFHPDELLGGKQHSSVGFLYSLDHLEKNLLRLIDSARKKGRDVAFVTGVEALKYIQRLDTRGTPG
jgi:hypothetical protein